jgi:hypothetical protein
MMNDSPNPEGFRMINPQVLADEITSAHESKITLRKDWQSTQSELTKKLYLGCESKKV